VATERRADVSETAPDRQIVEWMRQYLRDHPDADIEELDLERGFLNQPAEEASKYPALESAAAEEVFGIVAASAREAAKVLIIMHVRVPMGCSFEPPPEVKRLLQRDEAELLVAATDASSYTITVRTKGATCPPETGVSQPVELD
jgi:hypothetical protein